jgi:hypothetical protein
MGAEISTCIHTVFQQYQGKHTRIQKLQRQLHIAQSLNLVILRVLQLVYQISTEGDEKIGHLGGLFTGALLSLLL